MNLLRTWYRKCMTWYDKTFSQLCQVSCGDLMHLRGQTEENQFLAASWLLDIEGFYLGEESFPYQTEISARAYGLGFDAQAANAAFAALICSCQEKGYDPKSYLLVDRELRLMDGNHRMGMQLYLKAETVGVRVSRRKSKNRKDTDAYFASGVREATIAAVTERLDQIRRQLAEAGDTFGCRLSRWEPEAVEELRLLTTVWKVYKLRNPDGSAGAFVQFTLQDPDYHAAEGRMIAKRTVEIQRLLTARHPELEITVTGTCLEGKALLQSLADSLEPVA